MEDASSGHSASFVASYRVARQSVATDAAFGLDAVPVRPVALGVSQRAIWPSERRAVELSVSPRSSQPEVQPDVAPHIRPEVWPEVRPEVRPETLIAQPIQTLSTRADVRALSSEADRAAALAALEEQHARGCPHCTTATAHTRLVFGEGSAVARLMFIGEAPGETEDEAGRPFVGRAGQKLDEMIRAMGLRREDVYIANVLKSRPPENRTPLQHEVDRCGPYLIEQIRIIRPTAIVTLGGPATKLVLATDLGITRLRGAWGRIVLPLGDAAADDETLIIPVMPTFHPAYLLRNYTPETRRQVWHDLQAVLTKLNESA
jgi:uracil-DNA glycosylase